MADPLKPTTGTTAAIFVSEGRRGRFLVDLAFILGVVVACGFAFAEIALKLGLHFGPCEHVDSGTPWGLLIIATILIAPKTLGPAVAGRLWLAVGERIAGRKLDNQPPPGGAS